MLDYDKVNLITVDNSLQETGFAVLKTGFPRCGSTPGEITVRFQILYLVEVSTNILVYCVIDHAMFLISIKAAV